MSKIEDELSGQKKIIKGRIDLIDEIEKSDPLLKKTEIRSKAKFHVGSHLQ